MQPFSRKTVEVILLAILLFAVVHYTTGNLEGLAGLFTRTIAFMLLFLAAVYFRNISPDVKPLVHSVRKKLGV
jgi:hypothetical protein